MTVNKILNSLHLTDNECILIFRRIICFFELVAPDDEAFNLFDSKIKNYCLTTGLEIIPRTTVAEVDAFCRDPNKLIAKYKSGFIVFSHSGKNQLRQLSKHMRNACSHARIRVVTKDSREYIEFKARDPNQQKIKLLALIQREQFEKFWGVVIQTIKLK